MASKIVAVTDDGEYVAVELEVGGSHNTPENQHLALTGTAGEIRSESVLDSLHEENTTPEYMESNYGYLWEQSKEREELDADSFLDAAKEELGYSSRLLTEEEENDEGFVALGQEEREARETEVYELAQEKADEAQREARADFFERLADDFEWPYPYELDYDIGDVRVGGETYFAIGNSWGQVQDELARSRPLIPREDLDFLVHAWNTYHLKKLSEVPPQVVARLRAILDPIDNEAQMARILGMPQNRAGAGSRVVRQRSGSSLGTVPVVPHYRRLP